MQPEEIQKKIDELKKNIEEASFQYGQLGKTILVLNGELKAYSEMLSNIPEKKKNNK